MSLFSKLFGGGGGGAAKSEATPEEHDGYQIYVEPMSESGGYRVAARIEKEIDGTLKSHHMIRADTCQSLEEAERITLFKAKQVIDQQGDAIFA